MRDPFAAKPYIAPGPKGTAGARQCADDDADQRGLHCLTVFRVKMDITRPF
jgi:hypothetical protein